MNRNRRRLAKLYRNGGGASIAREDGKDGTEMKNRVVIYRSEDGMQTVFSDAGIEVYWVDETAPNDRIYQMNPDPIPTNLISGTIGHAKDGSAAMIKAERFARSISGRQPFDVITE